MRTLLKHKKWLLLILAVGLTGLQACKTDAFKPDGQATVVGKWYLSQHNLKLVKNGEQIGETVRTNYSKDDFIQFFEDGTGYQSVKVSSATPSLIIFHYTLKDKLITMYINGSPGVEETITKLTETEFAIHYESQIPDPYTEGAFNTEIDDYAFVR
ncbi:MAG TPA: lipocalin family protein [Mucilaginibacter sp.]|nr:lipocalin family protein [Mucilaginibacter sp.]